MIAVLLLLVAEATSVKATPPQTRLLSMAERQAILAPVNRLFGAIKAKDGQKILSLADPDGRLAAVEPTGVKVRTWCDYAEGFDTKAGSDFEERLLAEPEVDSDRDVAIVSAPYEFLADGKAVACGTDHFELVREAGDWKLLNVTWSQRKPGDCKR